jgi:hypothetical protein
MAQAMLVTTFALVMLLIGAAPLWTADDRRCPLTHPPGVLQVRRDEHTRSVCLVMRSRLQEQETASLTVE